jgi:hypothetical protein
MLLTFRPVQNVQTKCPVNNCPAQPKTRTMLRGHFCTMHHEDSIIIVQEGELTRCPNCRMFVKVVTPRHVVGSWCRIQAAQLQERERVARLANMARNIKFYINDTVRDCGSAIVCSSAQSVSSLVWTQLVVE